jgi:hypothetical protein
MPTFLSFQFLFFQYFMPTFLSFQFLFFQYFICTLCFSLYVNLPARTPVAAAASLKRLRFVSQSNAILSFLFLSEAVKPLNREEMACLKTAVNIQMMNGIWKQ